MPSTRVAVDPTEATATAADPTPVTVTAAGTLMQNYLELLPVSAGTQVATLVNANGEAEVFSLGSDGNVYWFHPDPTSDTGWTQATVPFGQPIQSLAAALTPDGRRLVLAGGKALCYMLETSPGSGEWGAPVESPGPVPSPVRIRMRLLGGALYIAAAWSMGGPYQVGWSVWGDEWANFQGVRLVNEPDVDFAPLENFYSLVAAITPQLYFSSTDVYQPNNLYWDKGSGAHMDGAFWRPASTKNAMPLGDHAQGNYNPPVGSMLLVQSVDSPIEAPLMKAVTSYSPVWNDKGSGAHEDGAVWWPESPGGEYVTLGGMAQPNYNPPPGDLIVALRRDVVGVASIGKLIWNDRGSGAHEDVSIYEIVPGEGQVRTGCFYAQPNYNSPGGTVYCPLAKTSFPTVVWQWSGTAVSPNPSFQAAGFALTLDQTGAPWYFLINKETGAVWGLEPGATAWGPVATGVTFVDLAASLDSTGSVEVWALGADSNLYHVGRANNQWQSPVPVLQQVQHMAVVRDGDGLSQVFAVTSTNHLFRVWRDADTTNWQTEEIAVQRAGTVQEVHTYTTVITATDAADMPLAGASARVWASHPLLLTINGGTYQVDSVRAASVTTNPTGQIVISSVSDSLSTATLSIWVSPMAEGETATAEPNAAIQAKLAVIDSAGVLAARTPSGTQLLRGDYRTQEVADAIAQALRQAMALAAPASDPEGLAGRPTRGRVCPTRWTGHVHGPRQIPRHRLAGRSWTFRAAPGAAPSFRFLSDAEVHAERARLAALPQYVGGFGLDFDLGDLLDEVEEGFVSIVSTTVHFIEDTVKASFDLIVNGVRQGWEVGVSLVEEAFDLVQLVWQQVQVAWAMVRDWLALFFDWGAIQRTAEAVVYTINTLLGFAQAAAGTLQRKVDSGIQSAESEIHSLSQQLIAALQKKTFLQERQGAPTTTLDLSDALTSNILFNALMSAIKPGAATSPALAAAIPAEAMASLGDVWQGLTSYLNQVLDSQAVKNAQSYFQAAFSSRDAFLQNTIAGLVSVFEAILTAALTGLQTVVDAFFAAFGALMSATQSFLNTSLASIVSPYLEELLEIAGGPDLTVLGVFSYVVAVPATVICKIAFGAAPFPSDSALSQFTQSFNVQSLLAMSGWGSLTGAAAEIAAGSFQACQKVYTVFYATVYFLYGLSEPFVDMLPPDTPAPTPLSWLVMMLEWLEMAFSIPWLAGLPGGDANGWVITNWVVDVIACSIDQLFLWKGHVLGTNAGDFGVMYNVVFGGLDLVLGLTTSIVAGDVVGGLEEVFGAITDIGKVGRNSGMVDSTDGASLLVTAGLDFIGDEVVWGLALFTVDS